MKVVEIPIEVIAIFNTAGEPKPARFRITESEEIITCDINRIIKKDKKKVAGQQYWSFDCQINSKTGVKLCELRYIIGSCKWILYKI